MLEHFYQLNIVSAFINRAELRCSVANGLFARNSPHQVPLWTTRRYTDGTSRKTGLFNVQFYTKAQFWMRLCSCNVNATFYSKLIPAACVFRSLSCPKSVCGRASASDPDASKLPQTPDEEVLAAVSPRTLYSCFWSSTSKFGFSVWSFLL